MDRLQEQTCIGTYSDLQISIAIWPKVYYIMDAHCIYNIQWNKIYSQHVYVSLIIIDRV